jgi:hypothetical protein
MRGTIMYLPLMSSSAPVIDSVLLEESEKLLFGEIGVTVCMAIPGLHAKLEVGTAEMLLIAGCLTKLWQSGWHGFMGEGNYNERMKHDNMDKRGTRDKSRRQVA